MPGTILPRLFVMKSNETIIIIVHGTDHSSSTAMVMVLFYSTKVYFFQKKILSNFQNQYTMNYYFYFLQPMCELGSRYEKELKKLDALGQKHVSDVMKKFLVDSTNYLLKNLPLDEQVIFDARVLRPEQQKNKLFPNAIQRLGSNVWKALGSKQAIKVFSLKSNATENCLIDMLKSQGDGYTTEVVGHNGILEEKDQLKSQLRRPSYWAHAYSMAGIGFAEDAESKWDFEGYWKAVSNIKDENGNQKYIQLTKLAHAILVLPHGNAEPERGFSINKHVLDRHSQNLSEETLEAIRTTKDVLIHCGGLEHLAITKEMVEAHKSSHSSYQKALDEKRKEREDCEREIKQKEEARKKQQEQENSRKKIEELQARVEAADELINDGINIIGNYTKMKSKDEKQLAKGHEKMILGQKRKEVLKAELEQLKKRKTNE